MNNIFDGSSYDRRADRWARPAISQLQYNLFFNNTTNLFIDHQLTATSRATSARSTAIPSSSGRSGAVDATAQNFELEPTSPAIDAARSEIGPLAGGNAIYPAPT